MEQFLWRSFCFESVKSHGTTFPLDFVAYFFFVDVIGEGLLDCETIFVKFTILEFKGNLGYRSMRCLISVSWTYNFKYFCPVISDSLKSDRLRYLAWKSFYKIFRTFRAKGGRRKLNILQSEISFQSKNANTSVILQFLEGNILASTTVHLVLIAVIIIIILSHSLYPHHHMQNIQMFFGVSKEYFNWVKYHYDNSDYMC